MRMKPTGSAAGDAISPPLPRAGGRGERRMIRLTLSPPQGPSVSVELPEGREIEVLARACERIFPGPVDPVREAGSEARYQEVMLSRVPPEAPQEPRRKAVRVRK